MAKPKIFVSHSTKDNTFASKLVADLNSAGAEAWMDVNDLRAGNFQENISKALAHCEWFLLVLTRNALASDWVTQEVDAANRLKHQKRIKELIFIKAARLDLSELPALWGVFNIYDATVDYAAALDRTLKDIELVGQSVTQPNTQNGSHDEPMVLSQTGEYVDSTHVRCPYCGTINPYWIPLAPVPRLVTPINCANCGKTFNMSLWRGSKSSGPPS